MNIKIYITFYFKKLDLRFNVLFIFISLYIKLIYNDNNKSKTKKKANIYKKMDLYLTS